MFTKILTKSESKFYQTKDAAYKIHVTVFTIIS